jgi:hypothetical protein
MNAHVGRPSTDSRALYQIGQDVYRAEGGRTVALLCGKPFREGRTSAEVLRLLFSGDDQASATEVNYVRRAPILDARLAGAISRMSAVYEQGLLTLQRKRTGGNQHVTVKHIP